MKVSAKLWISGVVLLIASGLAYFAVRRPEAPGQPETISTSTPSAATPTGAGISRRADQGTDHWATYQNQSLAFEMKYPQTLQFTEERPAGVPTVTFTNPEAGKKVVFTIAVVGDENSLNGLYGRDWQYQGDAVIGGQTARKFVRKAVTGDVEAEMTGYLIPDKRTSLTVYSSKFHHVNATDLEKILASFRFLN